MQGQTVKAPAAFTALGSGTLGHSARFDFHASVKHNFEGATGDALMSLLVIRNRVRGLPGYEVSAIVDDREVFWVRGEATLGGRVRKVAGRNSATSNPLGVQYDDALAMVIISTFYGKASKYSIDDAVSSLAFNLAHSQDPTLGSTSEMWFRHGRATETFAREFLSDTFNGLRDALRRGERSAREADAQTAQYLDDFEPEVSAT